MDVNSYHRCYLTRPYNIIIQYYYSLSPIHYHPVSESRSPPQVCSRSTCRTGGRNRSGKTGNSYHHFSMADTLSDGLLATHPWAEHASIHLQFFANSYHRWYSTFKKCCARVGKSTPIMVVTQLHNPHTIDSEIEMGNSYHRCYLTSRVSINGT